jgi:hypothetical protein
VTPPSSAWSKAQDDYLRKHYGKGNLSASAIGLVLRKTRSAIIGRAHRLGLQAVPQTPEQAKKLTERRLAKHRDHERAKRRFLAQQRALCRQDHPQPAVTELPNGSVSILEVREHHCRAIIGEASVAIALFCGKLKVPGSSYCAEHHAQFVTPPPRQRVGVIFKRGAFN